MNSQNVPIRDAAYADIRRLFIAPEGLWLVRADYNQLELRILAESGQVSNLITAYQRRGDIHKNSALELVEPVLHRFNGPAYAVWMEWALKDKRYFGKNKLNFPSIYGVEAPKMVEMANKSFLPMVMREAREILKLFDARYPQIEEHRNAYQAMILATGEARTLYNRRRIFPGLHQLDRQEIAAALREGFNHRIQGTAADLFKLAWLALWRVGLLDEWHRIVNAVHDELVFYIPQGDLPWCLEAKQVMESVTNWAPFPGWPMREWSVPLEVEFAVGSNWYDTTPIEELLTPKHSVV